MRSTSTRVRFRMMIMLTPRDLWGDPVRRTMIIMQNRTGPGLSHHRTLTHDGPTDVSRPAVIHS